MTTNATALDVLVQDIHARVAAMDSSVKEAVSEERIRNLVMQNLQSLLSDPDTARKFRFSAPEPQLAGTKYARWGLSVADIEFLYDLQVSMKGQRRVDGGAYTGPSQELENTFRAISDACYISNEEIRQIDKQAIDNLFPRVPRGPIMRAAWLSGQNWITPGDRSVLQRGAAWADTSLYQNAMRAMDTAESGFGSQLIGAQYVGELWEGARRESRIFGTIEAIEMTAPTMYLPVEVDFPELLYVSENTANNSSDYTTVKTGSQRVQVDAKKFVIHQMWSGEMEEDSIVPFIPFLRRQVMQSLGFYSDSLVLNGDTTNAGTGNINLDDADPADTKYYLAFDGIRHAGLVDNTANSADLAGNITMQALSKSRGRMVDTTRYVDWGHPIDKNDLIYTCDLDTADRICLLDEIVTADKAGSANTAGALNGEVTRILGHPLIPSIAVSKTEADGKVSTTGSNNVKGQVIAYNRRGFKIGWRRRVKSEAESLPGRDQMRVVYSLRMGFGRFTPTGAASGIEAADVIYDISL